MLNFSHLLRQRAITGLALVCAWPLAAQVDLGLTPMRVEFPAVPGKAFSSSLTLSNAGAAKARVRTELLDLYVDETTTPQFVAKHPRKPNFPAGPG